MTNYQLRYNAALKLFKDLQEKADKLNAVVFYDGQPTYEDSPFYTINEDGDILVKQSENCYACMFMNNVDYDEGMHTPIPEYKRRFEENFSLWKKISLKSATIRPSKQT